MAEYQLHFFCNECSGVHRFPVKFTLDNGPVEKARLGDVYQGEELPNRIATFLNNHITCPVTGKMTEQRDNNQLFIVPVSQ